MKAAAVIVLFLLFLGDSARAVELRLSYIDQDVRPYVMGDGAEIPDPAGMAIDLVRRVVSRIGGTLRLSRFPPRRNIEEIRADRQDGIVGYRYAPDRTTDLVFPMLNGAPDRARMANRMAYSVYRRKNDVVGWDGRAFSNLKNPVAVSASTLILNSLTAQGVNMVRVENNTQIFGMLALSRIDAAVALDLVGDRLLREQPSLAVEKLSPPLLEEEFYVPVSRKFYAANREFTERFWQVMGELRDVTYAELAPKYLF